MLASMAAAAALLATACKPDARVNVQVRSASALDIEVGRRREQECVGIVSIDELPSGKALWMIYMDRDHPRPCRWNFTFPEIPPHYTVQRYVDTLPPGHYQVSVRAGIASSSMAFEIKEP